MFDRHFKHWPSFAGHGLSIPQTALDHNLTVSAGRYPGHAAIQYYGGTVTYAELEDQVNRLAGYLQQRMGVAKGDRVLLYMQNSPQFIIAFFAILRAGAVVVPANPMNGVAEMRHLTSDTGANVALAGQELLPKIQPLRASGELGHLVVAAYGTYADQAFKIALPAEVQVPARDSFDLDGMVPWHDALAAGETPTPTGHGPDDLAVIPYSSGTTGAPKGCVHTHRGVMATAVGGVTWYPTFTDNATLVSLPMFHVTGMQNSMNAAVFVGATMVVMTRWDRATAAHLIEHYRVSRWVAISTMVIDLLHDPDVASYDLSSLDMVSGGGAAMPEAIAKQLFELVGNPYIEGYGLSETMAATHINPITNPKRQCLGIPVFDVDCRIRGVEDGRLLGPNEPGEIIVRAPQVFQGYWNNPEATAEAFVEVEGQPFFCTGDIGYYDEDGYFFMVDRVKRMINAAGFKVWPAEVESMMHAHPDINDVVIIGKPDSRRGETVKAFVSLMDGRDGQVSPESIIAWCHENMAAYKCPRLVEIVESVPRSATGKPMWRELQEQERTAAPA